MSEQDNSRWENRCARLTAVAHGGHVQMHRSGSIGDDGTRFARQHGGRSKSLGRPAPHGHRGAGSPAAAAGRCGAAPPPDRDAAGGVDRPPAAARRKPCDRNQRAGSNLRPATSSTLSRNLTVSWLNRLGIPLQRIADQQLRKVRPRRPSPAEEGQSPAVPKPNRRLPASALESLEVGGQRRF